MQQAQRAVEHVQQHCGCRAAVLGGGARSHARLGQFDCPRAEFVPEEIVERVGRLAQFEFIQRLRLRFDRRIQPRQNPLVLRAQMQLARRLPACCNRIDTGHHKARRVPHFVREISTLLEARAVQRPHRRRRFRQRLFIRHGLLKFFLALLARHRRHGALARQFLRFVAERADDLDREFQVLSAGAHVQQRVAHRVGAVTLDDVERVDAVALALGHDLAVAVEHGAMDHHVAERLLAQQLFAHHDHARHPEIDDSARGHERVGRIKVIQLRRLLRPAQRAERPQRAGEPRVQHVGFLDQALAHVAVAFAGVFDRHDRLGVLADHVANTLAGDFGVVRFVGPGFDGRDVRLVFIEIVPHGQAVAPPHLAGDRPVAHVVEPFQVHFFPAFRMELHAPFGGGFHRKVAERLHLHEPLRRQVRLHDGVAAVAVLHLLWMIFDLAHKVERLQILDDFFARFETVEAAVGGGRVVIDRAAFSENVDRRQIVALADQIIDLVVRGRHLQAAGTEAQLQRVVGHDRNLAAHQRQHQNFAHELRVALVVGMHGHAGVAEHRFGARGGHGHEAGAVFERVAQFVDLAFHVLGFGFVVAERRAAARAPVDEVLLAAVHQAVFVQFHEGVAYRFGQAFIHGEARARPVAGRAELAQLFENRAAGFFLPLPDAANQFGASDFVAAFLFGFGDLFFNHVLRGDAGVVGAGHPQRLATGHAAIADQRVLNRIVQRVADVQHTGDVGRRNHDAIRCLRAGRLSGDFGVKNTRPFPIRIDAVFKLFGVVLAGKRFGSALRSQLFRFHFF